MRAYIIKDTQMEDLKRRLELARFQQREPAYNPEGKTPQQILEDLHRWFNYHLHVWLDEVGR